MGHGAGCCSRLAARRLGRGRILVLRYAVRELLDMGAGPRMDSVQTAPVVKEIAEQAERESGEQAGHG